MKSNLVRRVLHRLADQLSSKLDFHPWTLSRISWLQAMTRNQIPPSLPNNLPAHHFLIVTHHEHFVILPIFVVQVRLSAQLPRSAHPPRFLPTRYLPIPLEFLRVAPCSHLLSD